MRILLKLFVLAFIGLALLPAIAPAQYRTGSPDPDSTGAPSAFTLVSLVGQAAADLRTICQRRAEMCETGRDIISYTGTKAREGLVIAYAMFRHGHPSMQESEPTADAG